MQIVTQIGQKAPACVIFALKRPTTEVIDLKKGRRSGCNGLRQAWLPQEDQRRENSIPASSSFFCVSSRSLPDRAAVRTL